MTCLTAKWFFHPPAEGVPGRIDFISATSGNVNPNEDDRGLAEDILWDTVTPSPTNPFLHKTLCVHLFNHFSNVPATCSTTTISFIFCLASNWLTHMVVLGSPKLGSGLRKLQWGIVGAYKGGIICCTPLSWPPTSFYSVFGSDCITVVANDDSFLPPSSNPHPPCL